MLFILYFTSFSISYFIATCHNQFFFVLNALHVPLIALSQIIGAHGTDVSVGVRLLSGKTLLQAKNSTGHRWDSNQFLADSMVITASTLNHCAT